MRSIAEALIIVTALAVGVSHAQPVDQRATAQALATAQTPDEVAAALQRANTIPTTELGPELRVALIGALEREGQRHRSHGVTARAAPKDLSHPELILSLVRTVTALKDPRSIPALGAALGTGMTSAKALAQFGEPAVAALVAVVTSDESPTAAVDDGLISLRLLVEQHQGRLSAASTSALRQAADHRLRQPGRAATNGVTVRRATDLAIVLGDPSLRTTVVALANDPATTIALGITDQRVIERVQKNAQERLAGVPALPRP